MNPTTDIDKIRTRPGMYVGDPRSSFGTHQLVWEVLANAVDEHLAGRCRRIDVALHSDGAVSVADDGAGISLDVDANGVPWLQHVLTTVHHTATADGHAPHVHLRRHHVGLCLVAALSSSFSAVVRRDGEAWRIELAQGNVTRALASVGPCTTSGTTIRFIPDATVFDLPRLDVETIARRVRELASLLSGLTTSFSCEEVEHASTSGVADLLRSPSSGSRKHRHPLSGEVRRGHTVARVAFEWRHSPVEPTIEGYCNLDVTPEGTHIRGFRRGLAEALDRTDHRLVWEALSPGLHAVVSVLVVDPEYKGPTRERIASKAAEDAAREATSRALRAALASDPELQQLVKGMLPG